MRCTTLPRPGDVIECTDCGRTASHARLLALCDACGKRVRVRSRAARPARPAALARFGLARGGVSHP